MGEEQRVAESVASVLVDEAGTWARASAEVRERMGALGHCAPSNARVMLRVSSRLLALAREEMEQAGLVKDDLSIAADEEVGRG